MSKPKKKKQRRRVKIEMRQRMTLVEKNDKTRVARKVYPSNKMRMPTDAGLNFRIKLRRKE